VPSRVKLWRLSRQVTASRRWSLRRCARHRVRDLTCFCQFFETVNLSGQGHNASRAAQGIVDCPVGSRAPDRATAPRREAVTSPPVSSSQRNVFTRPESQGQGPLCGQLSCATRARRVEKRVIRHIVGDSINDEDRCVVPELSQPLVWACDMQYVIGQ